MSLVGASLASGCALVKGHELRGCPNLELVQNGLGLEGEFFLFQYWTFSSKFLGGPYFLCVPTAGTSHVRQINPEPIFVF